tara:strand:+ start:212 stop:1777 length:1566 start_codon:yes stop_codon:yes gene_type:complete
LSALDSFDDRYLGQKSADVSVDNDGDSLVSGALYYNTTDDIMKVYDGSQWVAAYASLSGAMFGANNLSDVASTSGAVANLGLVIGTNVQAFSAILANTTASYTTAEESKLAGIEANATADQTNAEIRAAVEAASDSNVFTDADHTKLNGIEASATADQTSAEIRALVESASDSNVFTDADHSKLNAIEANAKDDQTITAGSGLSGGGTGDVTLSHADTSSVGNSDNSGNTFIQDINFDTYGHVTSVGTGTVSVGNGTLTVQGTGALGGSGTFTANQSGNSTISISHDDTSSQGSSNNSGRTYIQDITLDTYGHVTGLATATETVTNTDTNTTYSAGSGLSLSGTTFSHPTGNGNNHIPSGGSANQLLTYASAGTAQWTDPAGGASNVTVTSSNSMAYNDDKGAQEKYDAGQYLLEYTATQNCLVFVISGVLNYRYWTASGGYYGYSYRVFNNGQSVNNYAPFYAGSPPSSTGTVTNFFGGFGSGYLGTGQKLIVTAGEHETQNAGGIQWYNSSMNLAVIPL